MSYLKSFGKGWMIFWEVVLAIVFGTFLFTVLNIFSAGVFITLVTVGACFAVVASIHYLLWGRGYSRMVSRGRQYQESSGPMDGEVKFLDDFVVELNDGERKELMQLLERSVAERATNEKQRALRRELLKKLHMFGA